MVKDAVPFDRLGRALVVKLGHYGDVLLATPVLSALKEHAPHLEVDALAYHDTAVMLEGHPALHRLFAIPEGGWQSEWRLWRELRRRRYNLLIHLSEHSRGAWLARLTGARYRVGPARAERRLFWEKSFTHLYPVVRGNRRHQVELNLDALRRIGLQPPAAMRTVRFLPGASAEARVSTLLGPLADAPFIHLHPASRWRFKCWSAERNAELIDRLAAEGNAIVITGAPDEVTFVEEIVRRGSARPLNLAGQLGIRELGALTARARLFIGVDSMPMHLASAMGTPTLALFGPSGEHEWGPWNVERRVVTTTHSCRPCGFDGCGGGKLSECLAFLPVEPVHAAARELLALPLSRPQLR